mgnify:CR=1 FL=1
MPTRYYFAYGSNMSDEVFGSRVVGESVGCAVLRDYRLDFSLPSKRWTGYAAGIGAVPGSEVWGRLWEMDQAQFEILDEFEAAYPRLEVTVEHLQAEGGVDRTELVSALTYIVRPERLDSDGGAPVPEYLSHMVAGAEACGVPEHYIRFLKAISSASL